MHILLEWCLSSSELLEDYFEKYKKSKEDDDVDDAKGWVFVISVVIVVDTNYYCYLSKHY